MTIRHYALGSVVLLLFAGLLIATAPSADGGTPLAPNETFMFGDTPLTEKQAESLLMNGTADSLHYLSPELHGVAGRLFKTEAEGDAWARKNGLPVPPTGIERDRLEAESRARRSSMEAEQSSNAAASAAAGCPSVTYGGRFYDGTSCGGSYWGVFPNDSESNLANVGWNDRFASLVLENDGSCIQTVRYYFKSRYGPPVATKYSFNTPVTSLGSLNDEVSSYTSTCS